MKIGILFAGQGAQYPGMGRDLYDTYPDCKKIFDEAGEEVKGWCFDGTKELLRQTEVTQPSIYTVTMAAYEELKKNLKEFDIAGYAGFSLGEYAALVATGAISDFKTGLEIIKKRSRYMNESGGGKMAAAMGHREDILKCVEASREDGVLAAVNFNSPMQTVIAGDEESIQRLIAKAKEVKGLKTVLLSVGNAFHSPLMENASGKLLEMLKNENLDIPKDAVYFNVTGDKKEIAKGDDLADMMALQVKSPVYWQETIENMIRDGIDVFIEVGPGKTLSGLVNKINHDVKTLHIENSETLEATIAALKEMK